MLEAPEIIKDRNSESYREWQMNIAAAMQKFISDYTLNAISKISEKFCSKRENICLSGGFFMNCVFNGELKDRNFMKIYSFQSPADLGTH